MNIKAFDMYCQNAFQKVFTSLSPHPKGQGICDCTLSQCWDIIVYQIGKSLKKKNSDIFITFIANEVEAFNVIS